MSDAQPETPFHDLDAYIDLPRGAGLKLSPDGTRLVTAVQTLNPKRTKYVTALWETDPAGEQPARRLTRSAKGETAADFLPDGSLLFTSARPDPEAKDDDETEEALLWLLPAGGGEARVVASLPAVWTASMSPPTPARSWSPPRPSRPRRPTRRRRRSASSARRRRSPRSCTRACRCGSGTRTSAPALRGIFTGTLAGGRGTDPKIELSDLTPDAGRALERLEYDVSRDGSTIVTTWLVRERGGERIALALVDVATGDRRILLDDVESEYESPRFSPDGQTVAVIREKRSTPEEPVDRRVVVVSLADGTDRDLSGDWDRWPASPIEWTPDGAALLLVADENGRAPVFRMDAQSGAVTRLTADDFAYSDVQVSPDGQTVYAMRTSYAEPARPVRLDATTADQDSTALRGPSETPVLPGTLTEIETTAEDGARVRAWLALPSGTSGASADQPAPLLLWIHGGPLGSWNAWSWRWNPWLAVAQGYAVLLPDPGLSTGYGMDFIRRGWGSWGGAPFTDLMAITDAAVARDDIDETRTAAMGGSFGGYMANWVAGHTDRFKAIVTHASLWALDQFGSTTDAPWYWGREMTPEMAEANSPHLSADDIHTPMLVIHGDKDYRVPIGEGLRLFAELAKRAEAEDGEMPHKFLYFPDENHWVLTPQHAKLWYQTVLAFVDHHVLGKDWQTPDLLQ